MSVVVLQVTGFDRLRYILSASKRNGAHAIAQALYEEALAIFNRSQREVPVRFGILRGSGHISPITFGLNWAEVTIGYGGPSAPYAYWVHERVYNYRTGKLVRHDKPTKAKFLEDPALEAARDMDKRLTRRVLGRIFEPSVVSGGRLMFGSGGAG